MATSIVDYLFRVLGIEYLHRYDLAHVQPTFAATQDPTDATVDPPSTIAVLPLAAPPVAARVTATEGGHGSALDAQLDAMMGDAPLCDGCGHITVRNGACYKCLNCGNSMGCS
jgi:ribonucleoside-diphosphate reductase alpha chain